jgi:hypothetical protein
MSNEGRPTERARTAGARQPRRSFALGLLLQTIGWVQIAVFPATQIYLKAAGSRLDLREKADVMILGIAVAISGAGCCSLGRRLGLPNARDVLEADTRGPVLYLRPFDQDGFPSRDGRDVGTFEEQLEQFFQAVGPVVAIGRPGEALATPGAARLYVDDESWQVTVLDLLGRSAVVVLKLGLTPGTWWEFVRCVEKVDPTRLLLVLPYAVGAEVNAKATEDYVGPQQRYEDFWLRVAQARLPVRLPRSIVGATFMYFDRDWIGHLIKGSLSDLGPFLANIVD